MKLLSHIVLALLAATNLAQAAAVTIRDNDGYNNGFLSEFVAALEKNNLTTLAENYKDVAKTEDGKPVIDFLKNNGELTLLAPENCAFDPDYPIIDPDVLLYNTLWGSIDKGFTITNHTRRRRGPADSRYIAKCGVQSRKKRGNKRENSNDEKPQPQSLDDYQVQVIDQFYSPDSWGHWSNDRLILIDRAIGNAKVLRRFTFKKIIVLIIDTVLTLPTRVSELLCKPLVKLAPNGFTKFSKALQKAGLVGLVDESAKITIFAPIDDEFCDIEDFSKAELSSFVKNHFVLGEIVFSPSFPLACNATSESGKKLDFSFENGVHYVSCGKTRAVVLRRDVIPTNGVLHVINKPLKCD